VASPASRIPPVLSEHVLRARLAVLAVVAAALGSLVSAGCDPRVALAATTAVAVGGAEISGRLTTPYPAPWARVCVLVVIVILVIVLLGTGHPLLTSVAVALASVGYSAQAAVRLTGQPRRSRAIH
jgi:hypothetical protein